MVGVGVGVDRANSDARDARVLADDIINVLRICAENIQAWQILQGYKREPYNLGQRLALETLVRNHQSLRGLQVVGWLEGVDLRGADIRFADLARVNFDSARLDHTDFANSSLQLSVFRNCRCRGTNFSNSFMPRDDFEGADLDRAKFDGANLTGSDFTKMKYRRRGWGSSLPANPDQFANTCWIVGSLDGPPKLPPGFRMPQLKAVPGAVPGCDKCD
jgi:uncharacterized protein YjbI with pentapeptide repeats